MTPEDAQSAPTILSKKYIEKSHCGSTARCHFAPQRNVPQYGNACPATHPRTNAQAWHHITRATPLETHKAKSNTSSWSRGMSFASRQHAPPATRRQDVFCFLLCFETSGVGGNIALMTTLPVLDRLYLGAKRCRAEVLGRRASSSRETHSPNRRIGTMPVEASHHNPLHTAAAHP